MGICIHDFFPSNNVSQITLNPFLPVNGVLANWYIDRKWWYLSPGLIHISPPHTSPEQVSGDGLYLEQAHRVGYTFPCKTSSCTAAESQFNTQIWSQKLQNSLQLAA